MHFSAERASRVLRYFLQERLQADASLGSREEAALVVAQLLEHRSSTRQEDHRHLFKALAELLTDIEQDIDADALPAAFRQLFVRLQQDIAALDHDRPADVTEKAEHAVLLQLEALVTAINGEATIGRDRALKANQQIAQWDERRIAQHLSGSDKADVRQGNEIEADSLERYLRDRKADAELKVTKFARATGGFGKETIFFSATGAMEGDYVLRRDRSQSFVNNDCHAVAQEYPVIKAVSAKGFPAPKLEWLDLDHHLLPGKDFFIMKRSPGSTMGSIFGSADLLPEKTVLQMADAAAGLYRLGKLAELGNLNESINLALWSLPLNVVVKRYISGYYELFAKNRISALPSLAFIFEWLIDNAPMTDDAPTLVHADMAMHNLLFVDGSLSVVLDWEQAHIGDPLEDIAGILNSAGNSIDLALFARRYEEAVGKSIDQRRLLFQRIWCYTRNAIGCAMGADSFSRDGDLSNFNISHMGFYYYPIFLNNAMRSIAIFEKQEF